MTALYKLVTAVSIVLGLSYSAATQSQGDGMVDIGGRSLHIHCIGEGTPIVVFEAGAGDDSSTWSKVQPEVGRTIRACAYDRAGTGSSPQAPRPHTSREMADELHTLLGRARVPGPYVLVGHSLGGLNIRLYTSAHPGDVVGMVLVDASTEDQDAKVFDRLPPDVLQGVRTSMHNREGLTFELLVGAMADLRSVPRSLGDRPLVVLTHGYGKESPPPGIPAEVIATLTQGWSEIQAELPRLSSNSVQVVAENSYHFIQKDTPALVVAAVREVVGAVHMRNRLEERVLSPLGHLPREVTP
jgi:pimeloyl-ACP methyl ester carboxylesterase